MAERQGMVKDFWETIVGLTSRVKVVTAAGMFDYACELAADRGIERYQPTAVLVDTWKANGLELGLFEVVNELDLSRLSLRSLSAQVRAVLAFPFGTANAFIRGLSVQIYDDFFWQNLRALAEAEWLWSCGQGAEYETCFCTRDRQMLASFADRMVGRVYACF